MANGTEPLILVCDESVKERLIALAADQGVDSQSSRRRNLDGSAVTEWLIIAPMAIKFAPDLLRALADFLTRDRVKSIEFHGVKIEHPTPEAVRELIERLPDTNISSER